MLKEFRLDIHSLLSVGLFLVLGATACKRESTFEDGFDPRVNKDSSYSWNFANSSDYTFNSDYVSLTTNQARLKTVNTTFNSASTFNSGTHIGTVYSGGVLKLDSTTGSDTSLSSSWTPKWSNLVGYWKMDGDWLDSSGSANHGTNFAGTAFSATSKVGTQSGQFDGVDDYIYSNFDLGNTPSLTVSAWIKHQSATPSVHAGIVYKAGQKFELFLHTDGTLRSWITNDSAWHQATSTSTFNDWNVWHHVVATYDGSRVRIYRDGLLVSTSGVESGNIPSGLSDLRIGFSSVSTIFNGLIDDVAIWNSVALSASDISLIYNRQKQKYAGSYTSPIIDMGASGATWTSLASTTSLPFHKELPGTSGSESISDYNGVGGSLMNGLLGLWHFENNATDSSNSNIAPTPVNVSYSSSGYFSKSLSVSGANSYLNLGNVFNFPNNQPFTHSIWFNVRAPTNQYAGLFTYSGHDGQRQDYTCLVHDDSKLWCEVYRDGTSTATIKTTIERGKWQLVTLSNDGANLKLYLNGALIDTKVSPVIKSTSSDFYIGTRETNSYYFNGLLDEYAVWSRALSDTEVLELYRRGANRVKFQVRSCYESTCSCKAFNTAPVGSATDCDGDGILNTIDTSDSFAADFIGPDGAGTSYFSELQNNTSVSASGDPTGNINPTGLSLDWSSGTLSNITGKPSDNRYFQYRVYLESNDENNLCSGTPCMPEVTSITVGPTGRYFGGSPTVVNNSALSFTELYTMTKSDTGSCSKYQISTDSGATWKWWNGSAWTTTTGGVTEANFISDFTTQRLQSLGSGNFKFKAFLNTSSDFTQSCEISSIGITRK